MSFARSKALWLVTLSEAVTLEKSSVTAKCHSAKLLPIKLFLSSMTLVTLYCTDKVYRGEKNNEKCIRVKFIFTCIGLVKNESVICHVSQLAASAPSPLPQAYDPIVPLCHKPFNH